MTTPAKGLRGVHSSGLVSAAIAVRCCRWIRTSKGLTTEDTVQPASNGCDMRRRAGERSGRDRGHDDMTRGSGAFGGRGTRTSSICTAAQRACQQRKPDVCADEGQMSFHTWLHAVRRDARHCRARASMGFLSMAPPPRWNPLCAWLPAWPALFGCSDDWPWPASPFPRAALFGASLESGAPSPGGVLRLEPAT